MLINLVMWGVWHPRRYLPRGYKSYLAQDGVTEVSWQEGSGWADKRNLVMTVIDPFGLLAMFERGNKGEPFLKDKLTGFIIYWGRRRGRTLRRACNCWS